MAPVNLLLRRNISVIEHSGQHSEHSGQHSDTMFIKSHNSSTKGTSILTTKSPFDQLTWGKPQRPQHLPPGISHDIHPGIHESTNVHKKPPEFTSPNHDPFSKNANLPVSGQSGNDSTSGITYIIVGIAVVLIVVAVIAFVFLKRRRNLTRKLMTPVTEEKKLEFRNAIVTYKSEDECMGLDQPYGLCEEGLGKINPNFSLYPRYDGIVQHSASTAGIIPVTTVGGLYKHPHSDIYVSVPDGINNTTVKQICVINGPVRKPPLDLNPDNILSDMITLLPHHSNFNKHILVCFPVHTSKADDISKIQLIYSNTDPGEDPCWINLQQCKTPVKKHPDSIFWFVSGGYCYLYASHFCHVFLAQHCTLVQQPALFLQASVHGEYIHKDRKVVVRVGFHCSKCNPVLLEEKSDWGAILGSGFRCIYGKEGEVRVNVRLDGSQWAGTSHMKALDTDDLLNLCNLDDIYPPLTFIYKCHKGHPAPDVYDDSLAISVHMSQGTRKTYTIEANEDLHKLIKQTKTKTAAVRLERTSGPEENADTSLEPVEHIDPCDPENNNTFIDENANVNLCSYNNRRSYEEQQNDENRNRESGSFHQGWRSQRSEPCENEVSCVTVTEVIAQQIKSEISEDEAQQEQEIVPYEKKGGAVFNEHILDEEVKLCTMIESSIINKKENSVLLFNEICNTQCCGDKKNFTGQMILQLWNIKVKMNQKTWIKLHHVLHELKMDKIAQQLKVTFDKDKLVHVLDHMKLNLQMEPMLTKLLSKGIVKPSDIQEMRSLAGLRDSQWLEYLVYKVLCKQPAAKLYGFYDIIEKVGGEQNCIVRPDQLV